MSRVSDTRTATKLVVIVLWPGFLTSQVLRVCECLCMCGGRGGLLVCVYVCVGGHVEYGILCQQLPFR